MPHDAMFSSVNRTDKSLLSVCLLTGPGKHHIFVTAYFNVTV